MKNRTYSISRTIDIDSDTLFNIISDFSNYYKWNTLIPHAKGKLEIESIVELTLKMKGKEKPFNPTVIFIDSGKRFTLSKVFQLRGIGELTHDFQFLSLAKHKTEFIQTWTGKGCLVKMMWSKIALGFSDFEVFNDDLENYLMKQR